MDLRLPNFREIFVFHGVHKTFPLWRWTTNDATPWRSRTGTPLWGTASMCAGKIQFQMRRDIVRNRIMEMKFRFGFGFSKLWMRITKTNFECPQALQTQCVRALPWLEHGTNRKLIDFKLKYICDAIDFLRAHYIAVLARSGQCVRMASACLLKESPTNTHSS